ncbi:Cation-dependent mannose-6-phosphate receptor [Trachymyrmex zeteki]|uniref:Cation-dependent mannose-6-phosphate receptor n=1 Tax=Mycetomoellerius zeteki TaxID=64791 RepID=A0A151X8X0_9HYME|nr:Cation-dependent mannose-6-phosphate receptor [Trachymyrmex zeteki]
MRRRDRCRNAAAREDAFFRRATREPRGKRAKWRETKRVGDEEKRGRYASDKRIAVREAREREEDEELEDEEDVEEEEEEEERQKREPRRPQARRFSPPTTTRIPEGGLCLLQDSVNKTVLITGTIEETKMKLSDTGKFPIFEIHHNNIKMIINILCFTDEKTNFILDSDPTNVKTYYFKLISKYGCSLQREIGLSTGSLLVILFFVSVGVYFIGGIIVLKALRGATGWEMVPNHDFWCKLPSLVRDGVVFTFNCCRADSYERI